MQDKKNAAKPVKKTKRSQAKYPALKARYNLKIRQDAIDFDYLHKLSPKELDWLDRFMEEYNNASFTHKGEPIDNSPSGRKVCYDINNARNRDIYADVKKRGMLKGVDPEYIEKHLDSAIRTDIIEEDLWIEIMDGRYSQLDDTENSSDS